MTSAEDKERNKLKKEDAKVQTKTQTGANAAVLATYWDNIKNNNMKTIKGL